MNLNRNMQQKRKLTGLSIGLISAVSVAVVSLALAIFTWMFFMHSETVEPGHELVVIDKPYFFGHDGVRADPVKDGRILLFRTSTVRDISVTPFNVNVGFDDLSTKDNSFLDFGSAIQMKVLDSVKLVKNFNVDAWFASTIEQQYRQVVRDVVKTKTMTEIMSDPVAAKEIDDKVTAELIRLVKESGLPMQVIGVTLGRARPNASVVAEMDQTSAQQQRKKTLIEAKQAEDSRRESEEARAVADNAYRNKMGLDPAQFIELERIKRYSEACAKSTCIVTSGQAPIVVR